MKFNYFDNSFNCSNSVNLVLPVYLYANFSSNYISEKHFDL